MKKIVYYSLLVLMLSISNFVAKGAEGEGSGHDIGFSFGPNFALTDLGGAKKIGSPFIRDIDFQATRFCISVFYRYNVNKWLAVRGNLMYGMLAADDKNTDGTPPGPNGPTDSWYRARRNLNFITHIVEFQGMAEINLKKYVHDAGKGEKERWAPYIGGGVGFFWFDPYTKLNGEKVKLKPLGTEGQNIGYKKTYSNFQFDLIAMIGVKYNITEKFSVALEGVYHQTFTDYLDDVSGNYINPTDISKLSPEGQQLQNRANSGRYPSDQFNFVEGQRYSNPTEARYGQIITDPNAVGQQRGDKKDNDQFLHVQLTFTFSLGAGGKNLGFGACGKRNPYHHKFSCPKW
ncbi:MAG: hypothetical protein JWN78_277 [Bacteroidota bacterium]|nr:hypothetical protein [Bacteroidota bacterium]